MARRVPPKPSAPTARPASGPHFRAGERVRVLAGLAKDSIVPVVRRSDIHRFGDEPMFEVELPFPICIRVIRGDYLERAS